MQHGRHQRDEGNRLGVQGLVDLNGVEPILQDHRRPVQAAAQDDRQSPHVIQRHTDKPPIPWQRAQPEGRPGRAGQVVPVCQHGSLRSARRPRRKEDALHRFQIQRPTWPKDFHPGRLIPESLDPPLPGAVHRQNPQASSAGLLMSLIFERALKRHSLSFRLP